MTIAALRSAQAGAILTALGLSAGLMTGVAQADPPRPHECISPIFPGSNLNTRYGVSERIIGPPPSTTPPSPGCLEAFAGEKWVRAVPPWVTADAGKIAEFKDRFQSARYVTDEGTAQAKTVTAGKEILRDQCFNDQGGLMTCTAPSGLPFIALVSPVFHPLSVGTHTSTLYVTMSNGDPVCTGLSGNPPGLTTNCLPQGESKWPIADSRPFTVATQPPPSPGG